MKILPMCLQFFYFVSDENCDISDNNISLDCLILMLELVWLLVCLLGHDQSSIHLLWFILSRLFYS